MQTQRWHEGTEVGPTPGHGTGCRGCGSGHGAGCGSGCGSGCGFIAPEKNRWFTGKYVTAYDFRAEQEYMVSRHRLHQRLFHGWGIVCGLEVRQHPNPACRDRWVVIGPGVAVDCCGRELVLCEETPFELPLPKAPSGDEPEQIASSGYRKESPPGQVADGPFLICLRYEEHQVEQVPVLYSEGACDPAKVEANRVREIPAIGWRSLDEVSPDCWSHADGGMDTPCTDDCDDPDPGPAHTCLQPVCPCEDCVPLALIPFDPEHPDAKIEIDRRGRRRLPTPPHLLTHIVGTNWTHGGQLTLDQLETDLGGRLEIRFDRRILPADEERTGISEFTFQVQYQTVEENLEFLPFDLDHPPSLEDGCLAVYTIAPTYLSSPRRNISGTSVLVALKCDFILDCHDNPVDGDHLRGRKPTGDGVPGGIFESWFRVV